MLNAPAREPFCSLPITTYPSGDARSNGSGWNFSCDDGSRCDNCSRPYTSAVEDRTTGAQPGVISDIDSSNRAQRLSAHQGICLCTVVVREERAVGRYLNIFSDAYVPHIGREMAAGLHRRIRSDGEATALTCLDYRPAVYVHIWTDTQAATLPIPEEENILIDENMIRRIQKRMVYLCTMIEITSGRRPGEHVSCVVGAGSDGRNAARQTTGATGSSLTEPKPPPLANGFLLHIHHSDTIAAKAHKRASVRDSTHPPTRTVFPRAKSSRMTTDQSARPLSGCTQTLSK